MTTAFIRAEDVTTVVTRHTPNMVFDGTLYLLFLFFLFFLL